MVVYTVYTIDCDATTAEILLALLADAGMEAFEEIATGLRAYADSDGHKEWLKLLNELSGTYPLTYSSDVLENRNWNSEWEQGFSPIRIDDQLLIRASFHAADEGVRREIVIDPKMAFGTGHHATTYMMCERLLTHFEAAKSATRVLDFGSGTGVLAILAKQLGAAAVEAVDIELPAYESTVENARLNGVTLDRVVHGELADLPPGKPYDLLLANINRNVLLQTAGALYERLRPGATAYLSGILAQDAPPLIEHWRAAGFRHLATYRREDWRALTLERN